MSSKKITILGAGAWGTAIASILAHNGYEPLLWCYESVVCDQVNREQCNATYFPGFKLSQTVKATTDLSKAFAHSSWIFEAVPVKCLRSVLKQANEHNTPQHRWVLLSKGIEQETLALPSQILQQELGQNIPFAVLAGPNFADELAQHVVTATTVASQDQALLAQICALLKNDFFKPYLSADPIGVQVGGAIKNVLALLTGIAQTAGYKDNTTAFLLTRGLHEIGIIAQHYGGQHETVYGLSGLGDMILSSLGGLSKNLKAGRLVGQGLTIDQLGEHFPTLPEGINTVQSVHQLATKHNLDLPVCINTYHCAFQGLTFQEFLQRLVMHDENEEYSGDGGASKQCCEKSNSAVM
ncbi:MAG: NAD(P)-dependent glycerol-3-phosphate dehydrogenase [Epsilonproteobacteria bacterium]|nr:NAD(P)-dependent glycerol-3-phosphate dehydrogenase [Campylobacterota bacterium]